MKPRAKLLGDLVEMAKIYVPSYFLEYSEEALKEIDSADRNLLEEVILALDILEDYSHDSIKATLGRISENQKIKIGELMKPLRAIITGKIASPSVFDIIAIMGKENIISRIKKSIK